MVKLHENDIKTKDVLSMKGLHLFHFNFSACSMKTRIFLNLKNAEYIPHHIDLTKKENFSDYFQGISPRSLVPVLVSDGEVHIESNDILKFLERKIPDPVLIPIEKTEEINDLLDIEDELHIDIRNVTFKYLVPKFLASKEVPKKIENKATLNGREDSIDNKNRKYWKEYSKNGIPDEVAVKSLLRLRSHLETFNEGLAHHTYLLGNKLSVIDIAWFIYVTRLKTAKYPVHILHPHVNDWYEKLNENEMFSKEVNLPWSAKILFTLHYAYQKYFGKSIKKILLD